MGKKTLSVKNVVIVDANVLHDWDSLFAENKKIQKKNVMVYQTAWNMMSVVVDGNGKAMLSMVKKEDGKFDKAKTVTVVPDLVVVRNQPRGPTPDQDHRNVLLGLHMGGVPCMNSSESLILDCDRPCMYAEMRKIERRLGHDDFPVIPLTYFDGHRSMMCFDEFPAVMKVSHCHAGRGKVYLPDYQAFRDLATVMAVHDDYSTVEPFIDAEYGFRVQRIGDSTRVYKKVYTGSSWTTHSGGAGLMSVDPEPHHLKWSDACKDAFNGLDWFGLDGLHSKDGKDYLIELNGSAIGILADYWKTDSEKIVSMISKRV